MTPPSLQRGDEGPSVSALQLALAALGFDVGSVDGVFTDSTATAVSQFQASQGLDPSGAADDATWEALGGQPFDPSEKVQVSGDEFPSIARVLSFAEDVDAYLQDLGIDSTTITDDEAPVA